MDRLDASSPPSPPQVTAQVTARVRRRRRSRRNPLSSRSAISQRRPPPPTRTPRSTPSRRVKERQGSVLGAGTVRTGSSSRRRFDPSRTLSSRPWFRVLTTTLLPLRRHLLSTTAANERRLLPSGRCSVFDVSLQPWIFQTYPIFPAHPAVFARHSPLLPLCLSLKEEGVVPTPRRAGGGSLLLRDLTCPSSRGKRPAPELSCESAGFFRWDHLRSRLH